MVLGAPLSSLGGHLECLWDILGLPWEVIGLSFAGLLAVAGHAGHLKDLRVGFSFILCLIMVLCFRVRLSTQEGDVANRALEVIPAIRECPRVAGCARMSYYTYVICLPQNIEIVNNIVRNHVARRCCKSRFRGHSYNKRVSTELVGVHECRTIPM